MTWGKKNSTKKPASGGIILFLLAGLLLGGALKLFVLDILEVSGASMESAIAEGSLIPVWKLAYGIPAPLGSSLLVQWAAPKRGDVVAFVYEGKMMIKRCIAVGGDALEYDADSGYTLRVLSSRIPLSEHQYQRLKRSSAVPEGMIFAVGDNYMESIDSRNFGFVYAHDILGKVLR
jgi:signal peptidase I